MNREAILLRLKEADKKGVDIHLSSYSKSIKGVDCRKTCYSEVINIFIDSTEEEIYSEIKRVVDIKDKEEAINNHRKSSPDLIEFLKYNLFH